MEFKSPIFEYSWENGNTYFAKKMKEAIGLKN